MIRDSKARLGTLATQCDTRVKILISRLSKFCSRRSGSALTFSGFKSGSISEYPVANAIGRREESDLARRSASISVGEIKNQN
jgi:hypothetical protein